MCIITVYLSLIMSEVGVTSEPVENTNELELVAMSVTTEAVENALEESEKINTIIREIWACPAPPGGIPYFTDANGNHYRAEDIVAEKINPRLINTCK